jgi:hypothetical protein
LIFSFAKKRCLLWQRFFYKAPFIGELAAEGGLRGCFQILAGKRRDLSNILYMSLFMTHFCVLDKGGIPYEEEYYLSHGRGGFGLRAGLGL